MKHHEFLNRLEHGQIVAAIGAAEKKTSGEIRVFITRHAPADAVAAAQEQFAKLGLDKTRDKNGVLIFVAPKARTFAVIGDSGVHARCGEDFWTQLAGQMTEHFKKAQFTQGIIHGVEKAGELLAEHFPRHAGDKNPLPDEIAHD